MSKLLMHYSHLVHFAGSDESRLARNAAAYLRDGLQADGTCLVVTCKPRWAAMAQGLEDAGIGTEAALAQERLIWLDACDVLDGFCTSAKIDAYAFDATVGKTVRDIVARNGARPLFVYGDMVDILWQDGRRRTALELEWYWNDLGTHVPFTLYCGYTVEPHAADADRIAATHSHVAPAA